MHLERFTYETPPETPSGGGPLPTWPVYDRWQSMLTPVAYAVDRDMAERICEVLNGAE